MAPALEDVQHSVLITTIHGLHEAPNFLATAVSTAARHTTESLQIVIISSLFNPPAGTHNAPGISRIAHWDDVQRLLTFVYVQATKVAQDVGRILLNVDVLLRGTAEAFPEQVLEGAARIYSVTPHDSSVPLPSCLEARRAEIVALPPDDHPLHHPLPPPSTAADPTDPPLLPVVALGGTFDHLHAGHKILLSMGAWLARDKLIVGVTGTSHDALLAGKQHRAVLEPLAVRAARTRAFCTLFKPALAYDVVPIVDVYGPTGWDPNVQGLVVSKETLPGAASIDERRAALALPPLRTFVIDVISATEASVDAEDAAVLKTAKMSSTYIREWIVKQQQGTSTT
ncbi:Nucleotidylyl transferase [Epithele typhae]|uniref:Nucleotidylyl transferase n=1 Tax=Epithele typhae TaxID=378194 RepID=UPI002007DE6E|nr:Nucleotidylyl transferase [Epithele typhae]KAH9945877.1 Nucleotidylyl transferase [Epithele typhae]